jgi:hypothetical protein
MSVTVDKTLEQFSVIPLIKINNFSIVRAEYVLDTCYHQCTFRFIAAMYWYVIAL